MSRNTQSDIKTLAYVLRRTNYGEADRILNLITPEGKISAIAKGVRREKSRLAGGIEMFSLVELHIRCGKGELGVVAGAKMLKYYDKLLVDLNRMELAATILKNISRLAESSDSPEYFKIVDQCLGSLNEGVNEMLVEAWFLINLARVSGEEVNLYRDADGNKLASDRKYMWDAMSGVFYEKENGEYGVDEIKVLRLIMTTELRIVSRVKNLDSILPSVLRLARSVGSK